ncbi:C2 domain-containing protein [Abeliophyllum distichum]|uniref:C2 domain-containing protein n=1 Tax=Abeliophyllum distichum TaxID=126358 RepID=A0ABD1NTN7_9LAMI
MYSTARSPPLPTYPGRDYGGYSPAPYSSLPVVHQPPSMSSPPPPPAPQSFSYTYSDPYSGYYPGYYSQLELWLEHSGGLALEEGIKYEEEKIADRVENDLTSRDDHYSHYRTDY